MRRILRSGYEFGSESNFEAGLPAARFPYQTAGCPERLRLWFISKASIWNQSGMTYWRISELNLPELREYARLLQK
jgi:hypothetical protein